MRGNTKRLCYEAKYAETDSNRRRKTTCHSGHWNPRGVRTLTPSELPCMSDLKAAGQLHAGGLVLVASPSAKRGCLRARREAGSSSPQLKAMHRHSH
ncbi:hypothetical protein E2C01_097987 [Portunus trituberculatus]|uniref:Uncharacterized protein n=1 Tax=Portunus trituberculatus TaxID=210409 RepID=A0A5B7KAZ6_PORTR|nr:hypothetical protein [Portunus trituberculatus]